MIGKALLCEGQINCTLNIVLFYLLTMKFRNMKEKHSWMEPELKQLAQCDQFVSSDPVAGVDPASAWGGIHTIEAGTFQAWENTLFPCNYSLSLH